MEKAGDCVLFPLFDELPLYVRQRAAIEAVIGGEFRADFRWFNSRRKLFDRLVDGIVKVLQRPPVQTPAEGGTNVGACESKFDAVRLVRHRFLCAFYQPTIRQHNAGKNPL